MQPDPNLSALLGGAPVRPQGPPAWPGPDLAVGAALQAALADGTWGRYDGGHVASLEAALARLHGVGLALTCASGTLAVEAALRAVPVGPGDEVVLAAYDFEGNFLGIHATGATPVLADVSPVNGQFDPEALAAAVSPRTKAVLVSHLHGGLVPMRRVMAMASDHKLTVIEDAAQATGAWVDGRRTGTWGDVGVLSFGGSKLLTAGRGGAILTNNAGLHQRARLFLGRGVQRWAALSELQAVVLRPQLDRLDEWARRRAENVRSLLTELADVPGLTPLDPPGGENVPAYYKLGFRLDEERFGLSRARFAAALRAEGIAFDEGFRALHVGRAAGRFRRAGELSEAERLHREVVALHHPVLLGGPVELAEVAAAVRKTYRNAGRLRA